MSVRRKLDQAAASIGTALLRGAWRRMAPADRRWFLHKAVGDNASLPARELAAIFEAGIGAWKQPWTQSHSRYDVAANGEAALLRRLAPYLPRVVFDVGANVGEWSLLAHGLLPTATIHAFEIASATADQLEAATAEARDRIVVNRVGMADTPGEVVIHVDPSHSDYTSMLGGGANIEDEGDRLRFSATAASYMAPVTTGDLYVATAGIGTIDLLKIDVEGAERLVLQGFQETFRRGAVTALQMEYNVANIGGRFLLADIYALLEPLGFTIGRLDPRGVAFKKYDWRDEDFNGPNIVAVHRNREDVIRALATDPLAPL